MSAQSPKTGEASRHQKQAIVISFTGGGGVGMMTGQADAKRVT